MSPWHKSSIDQAYGLVTRLMNFERETKAREELRAFIAKRNAEGWIDIARKGLGE